MTWILAAIAAIIYLTWPVNDIRAAAYPEQNMTEAERIAYCKERQAEYEADVERFGERKRAELAAGKFDWIEE